MSKRRMFDINFPGEAPAAPTSDKQDQRRGPMATAISENADALRARQEAEQSIREENDRLAHEYVRLKKLGLMVDRIPLEKIKVSKLTRDRSESRDPELMELIDSIRSIGLSNPIRVEQDGDTFQLIQGFRRLSAFQELYAETGDERFATIPAGLIASGESLQDLYRRMVDENLVRRDISFAEMAQLALSYAEDPETEAQDVDAAVAILYASAGRQKRSYIRHFAELLQMIGQGLSFPEAIPRALGLDLKKLLSANSKFVPLLLKQLEVADDVEAELTILRQFLQKKPEPPKATVPVGNGAAKTTLRCRVPAGTVRCQARNGKIEMAMDRDFSRLDQQQLETAISAFFKVLDSK